MRAVKWIAVGLFLVLLTGAGVGWWQREPLQTWWILRGLTVATEAERDTWLARVAALGDPAVGPLVDALPGADDQGRQNLLAALDHLARGRGVGNPATTDLVTRLSRPFDQLAPPMRALALQYVAGWFDGTAPADGLLTASAALLTEAARGDAADCHAAGLDLANVLRQQPGGDAVLSAVRAMTQRALQSPSATVRLEAVRTCLMPGVEQLEHVVALLRDPSADVRRAAIIAVGTADQLVRDDMLLPGLHDTDADVRKHTEAALRARGLRPEHLELGRLLTHPQPTTRLQVLDRIHAMLDTETDLDPGVWLRRLSHDNSPAVRAAALRLMSQQSVIDLKDRIDQMARNDPSPTVSQLARYYQGRK